MDGRQTDGRDDRPRIAFSVFDDLDAYRESLNIGSLARASDIVCIGSGQFRSEVLDVKAPRLRLHRFKVGRLPRVTRLEMLDHRSFNFLTGPGRQTYWNGKALTEGAIYTPPQYDEAVFRADGEAGWTCLSMAPEMLQRLSIAFAGRDLSPPGSIDRMTAVRPDDLAVLAEMYRLMTSTPDPTRPRAIADAVARQWEDRVFHVLFAALAGGTFEPDRAAANRHDRIFRRLHALLATQATASLTVSEICLELGVSSSTLYACCMTFAGMSPIRYLRLRRLNRVRRILSASDTHQGMVASVAMAQGFPDMSRFAAQYRQIFGETPSDTLRRRG